jgi:hypothetical protein
MESELLSLLFPEGLLDYFKVTDYQRESEKIQIYLEEKSILPAGYTSEELYGNGFFKEIVVEDFPLRAHQVSLHIKRRRWVERSTRASVTRDWNLVAKGTRMTQEFASFLKEISR